MGAGDAGICACEMLRGMRGLSLERAQNLRKRRVVRCEQRAELVRRARNRSGKGSRRRAHGVCDTLQNALAQRRRAACSARDDHVVGVWYRRLEHRGRG